MTLSVYIAASSREVERVQAAQRAVAERGWDLTLDWLSPMLENIAAGRLDSSLSDAEAAQYAVDDLMAIDSADVVWFLCPGQPTKGAYVELGYALGRGIPVVCSGARSSIFEAPHYCHLEMGAILTADSDDEAIDVLCEIERASR